jgi:DNA polymerase (family 10)
VADHSKSAHYAGRLSLEKIEEQHREDFVVASIHGRFKLDRKAQT